MNRSRTMGTLAFSLIALCAWSIPAIAADEANGPGNQPPIDWQSGPLTGALGTVAEVQVPDGYVFADAKEARRLLEMMGNPTSGSELGVIMPKVAENEEPWFVFFEFDPVGYVKDDEKESLDAAALLSSIQDGNASANKERQKRGWSTLDITGWEVPPFYNAQTNNLEWAIRGESEGHGVVNYSTRLLGRKGVMRVDLVLSPEQLSTVKTAYASLASGFTFKSGEKYAEYVAGDKIAAYGLTALVAGGAGALAAKTGLLAKLWKLVVAGVVAAGAAVSRWVKALRGKQTQPAA
jgi:uncharacterized membrane-anchored protein